VAAAVVPLWPLMDEACSAGGEGSTVLDGPVVAALAAGVARLRDARVVEAARALGARLRREDGADAAADLLGRLSRASTPRRERRSEVHPR